jgi:hypothetical protein
MNKFTMTRIEIADQERLKAWAKLTRRSATQQLGAFIPPLPTNYEKGLEDVDQLIKSFDSKPKDLDKITEPYVELMSTPEQKHQAPPER